MQNVKDINIQADDSAISCHYKLNPDTARYEIQDVHITEPGHERMIHFNKNQAEQIADIYDNHIDFTAASTFVQGDLHEIVDLDVVLDNFGNIETELSERQKEQMFSFLKDPKNLCDFGAFHMEAGLLRRTENGPVVNLKELSVGFNYNKNGKQQTDSLLMDIKNSSSIRKLFSSAIDEGNGKEMARMINNMEYCLRHPGIVADMDRFYSVKNELCAKDILQNNPVINEPSSPDMLITSTGLKVPVAALEQRYPDALLIAMENHGMDAFLKDTGRTYDKMEAYLSHEISSGTPHSYDEFCKSDFLTTSEMTLVDNTIFEKKMDEVLMLDRHEDGTAFFDDIENGTQLSLREGLGIIYDALLPQEEEVSTDQEYDALISLMKEKEIIKEPQKSLDEQIEEVTRESREKNHSLDVREVRSQEQSL